MVNQGYLFGFESQRLCHNLRFLRVWPCIDQTICVLTKTVKILFIINISSKTRLFFIIFLFGNFTYLTFCHPILFPRPLKHNISMKFHRNFWKFSSLIKSNTKNLSYRFLIIEWLVHNQFMGLTNPLKVVVHYFLIGGIVLTIKIMFP